MSATIEDLEKTKKVLQAEVVDEFEGDESEVVFSDMGEACNILHKAMHLFSYVSDLDFCKRISKRERANMAWMSEHIRQFLDDKGIYYLDNPEAEVEDSE